MCLISDLLTADIVLHETEDWIEPEVFKSIQGRVTSNQRMDLNSLTYSPNRILLIVTLTTNVTLPAQHFYTTLRKANCSPVSTALIISY